MTALRLALSLVLALAAGAGVVHVYHMLRPPPDVVYDCTVDRSRPARPGARATLVCVERQPLRW